MSVASTDFAPLTHRTPDGREVVLRRAVPDDAEAVLAYMHDTLPEVTPYICTTPEEFDYTVEQERELLAKQDAATGALWMIAESAGRIVGSLNASPIRRRRLAHVALLGMTLRPEFRGVGLGTKMMSALIEWCERHPVTELLQLEVYADNERAQRLYRKLGFVEAGRVPRRMKFGPGEYKDAVLMYREVRPEASAGVRFELEVDDTLTLRLDQPEHADEMFAVIDRNREHLGLWMPWVEKTRSVDDTREVHVRMRHEFEARTDIHLAVVEHGRVSGKVGLHHVDDPNGSAELGYWLAAEAQGRGVMTRAARRLLDHAFGEYGLHRVYVQADARNARSRSVAERLGMRREGEFKQNARDHHGGYRDSVLYAVLRDEWEAESLQ